MIREEFYFASRDGENRIHAVRYTPDDGNVRGIVQIVHGMAEYVGRYENLAEFLTKRGILVTGEDHLGHGKSVSEGGSFGYFCEQDPATVVVRGCTSSEEDHGRTISAGALYYSGTQHGIFYCQKLSVPLR